MTKVLDRQAWTYRKACITPCGKVWTTFLRLKGKILLLWANSKAEMRSQINKAQGVTHGQ